MRNTVVLLGLLAVMGFPMSAGAQTMYRCGNSYSQEPCGPGARAIEVPGVAQAKPLPPDLPAAPEVVEAAALACLERLHRDVKFRDPDTVKVSRVDRSVLFRHPRIGATRVYSMQVNAKNAYGGYTGDQPFKCFTDPADERRVLLVQALADVR